LRFKFNFNRPLVFRPGFKANEVILVADAETNQMSSFKSDVLHALRVLDRALTHEHLLKRPVQWRNYWIEALWDYGTAECAMAVLSNQTCKTFSTEYMRAWQLHWLAQELQANRALEAMKVTRVLCSHLWALG